MCASPGFFELYYDASVSSGSCSPHLIFKAKILGTVAWKTPKNQGLKSV
jgi:hypothetical protein